jgi:hypothetical protein
VGKLPVRLVDHQDTALLDGLPGELRKLGINVSATLVRNVLARALCRS